VSYPFESLPENLAAFCELLRREHRFRIGAGELQDAARALELVNLGDERAVRNSLRPVLASRREELQVFDTAFSRFFRRAPGQPRPREDTRAARAGKAAPRGAGPDRVRERPPDAAVEDVDGGSAAALERGSVEEVSDAGDESSAGLLRARYSPFEAEGAPLVLEPADRAWREAAAALVSRVRAGRSRRWRPAARGQRFDLRRTLRGSLHTGADIVVPRWKTRPLHRPRFVFLIDGSRSMSAHAQPAVRAAVGVATVTLTVETFTFSTALRRITRDVRRAAAGERRRLHLERAWGGGTTIGACLREFLRRFGERLLGRDTVVIVASDGLDVGDPGVLRESVARLSRQSAALVWLNPLLETDGYEPTALGMSLARPYVSVLAAANDPEGLLRLARQLKVR
jgi:uncharacterized protein with von Willebrand factor type A (vWA) domain